MARSLISFNSLFSYYYPECGLPWPHYLKSLSAPLYPLVISYFSLILIFYFTCVCFLDNMSLWPYVTHLCLQFVFPATRVEAPYGRGGRRCVRGCILNGYCLACCRRSVNFFPWMNLQYWPRRQRSLPPPSLHVPESTPKGTSFRLNSLSELGFAGNLLWNNIYTHVWAILSF